MVLSSGLGPGAIPGPESRPGPSAVPGPGPGSSAIPVTGLGPGTTSGPTAALGPVLGAGSLPGPGARSGPRPGSESVPGPGLGPGSRRGSGTGSNPSESVSTPTPAPQQKTPAKTTQAPKQKVLVTGGGGYLGFSLGSSLAKRGTSVILLDLRRPQWPLPSGTEFIQVRDGITEWAAAGGDGAGGRAQGDRHSVSQDFEISGSEI